MSMPTGRAPRLLTLVTLVTVLLGVTATAAFAYWTTTGKGTGSASTTTLNPATSVTATTAGSISWTNSTSTGTAGAPITYRAERSDVANPDLGTRTWSTVCAAPATSPCTDSTFPTAAGSYRFVYRVVALRNAFWTANSTESSLVAFTIATAATKLVLTGAVTGAASNSPTLGPITVTSQTAAGAAANAPTGGYVVALSSNSTGTARFAATSGGTLVTSVTILAGSSSATFFYADTKAGSPTITAATSGLTSATQVETINGAAASKLTFINCSLNDAAAGTCPPGGLTNGGYVDAIVGVLDSFNNTATVPSATSWSIGITSSNSKFTVATSPVTITGPATQSNSFRVTYTNNGAASSTITASVSSGTALTSTTMTVAK